MNKIYVNTDYPSSGVSEISLIKKEAEDAGYELYYDERARPMQIGEMVECLADTYAFITDASYITGELLDRRPNIKIISRTGVGYDKVDVPACTERGVPVCITLGVPAKPVAEQCLALMLAAGRRIVEQDRAIRHGGWGRFIGPTLYNKTLGIIGGGAIGRQLIKVVQGFDMQILVYDLVRDEALMKLPNVRYADSLEELLRNADFVSISVPKNESTINLISMPQLEMMKPTAVLINTARGGIVNELDLYRALKENIIFAAGLDVFEKEPINADNPLLELENVVLCTHNSGSSIEGKNNVVRAAVKNVISLGLGECPAGLLNPETLKTFIPLMRP